MGARGALWASLMPLPAEAATAARARAQLASEDTLRVELCGDWRITGERERWEEVLAERNPRRVIFADAGLGRWDSSLVLFIWEAETWCRLAGAGCDTEALPAGARRQVAQMVHSHETSVPFDRSRDLLTFVGEASLHVWRAAKRISAFVGECTLSAIPLAKNPGAFRWRDCFEQMQQCGAMALPIVSLVSFLVGLILAFQAATFMRQFGADIYVADFVGISMVREMGPLMAAVTLAGRTGAAFAAQLATMKAGEEIDALETLGVRPMQFLVLPRILALGLMLPLLALYANCLGILGGVAVAWSVLEIPPPAFWVEMLTFVDLSDLLTGLVKAGTYGLLIGLAGCMRGLEADRSAAGAGRAATSAVVTSIVLMIIANALYAVMFNFLGL